MCVCVGAWWVWSLLEVGLVFQTGDDVIKCGPVFRSGGPAGLGQGGEVGWLPATDGGMLSINDGLDDQVVGTNIRKGYLLFHQLPDNDGKREDITLLVDSIFLGHLGGHPARCACDLQGNGCFLENSCCSKVADLGHHVIGEEDIAGLKIAMDIIKTVHECHSVGNLFGPGHTLLLRWLLFPDMEEVIQ